MKPVHINKRKDLISYDAKGICKKIHHDPVFDSDINRMYDLGGHQLQKHPK